MSKNRPPIIGCSGTPDPYFVLTNAGGGAYTSSAFTDVSTGQWTNLGLLLDNPPYSISFYDEDVIGGDDLLGTYNIPLSSEGTYFLNVAGGTTGSMEITNEPQQVFNDTAAIVVYPLPSVVLVENGTTSELCATDLTLTSFTWLLDGQVVANETGPCLLPSGPGVWQVVGFNGFGCSDTSNAIVVCPVFSIAQNGNVLFVPSGYVSYAWTFNGASIGKTPHSCSCRAMVRTGLPWMPAMVASSRCPSCGIRRTCRMPKQKPYAWRCSCAERWAFQCGGRWSPIAMGEH